MKTALEIAEEVLDLKQHPSVNMETELLNFWVSQCKLLAEAVVKLTEEIRTHTIETECPKCETIIEVRALSVERFRKEIKEQSQALKEAEAIISLARDTARGNGPMYPKLGQRSDDWLAKYGEKK